MHERTLSAGAETEGVPEIPDGLTLKEHRDLEGREHEAFIRRVLLALLALVGVLGLFNVFGQRPQTARASAPAATLAVYAPLHARGGLIYAARFHVKAQTDLRDARLVLAPGWAEGYTVNGLAPQPLQEGSSNGRLVYSFGHLAAGRSLLFFLSLQVNPTNVGRRSQDVELYDGDRRLAGVHRTITIFP